MLDGFFLVPQASITASSSEEGILSFTSRATSRDIPEPWLSKVNDDFGSLKP